MALDVPIINVAAGDGLPALSLVAGDITSGIGNPPIDSMDASNYAHTMSESVGRTGDFYNLAFKVEFKTSTLGRDGNCILCRGTLTTGNIYNVELFVNSSGLVWFQLWYGAAKHRGVSTSTGITWASGKKFWIFVGLDRRYTGSGGTGYRVRVYEDGSSTQFDTVTATAITGAGTHSIGDTRLGYQPIVSGYDANASNMILHSFRHYQWSGLVTSAQAGDIASGADDYPSDLLAEYTGLSSDPERIEPPQYRAGGVYPRASTQGKCTFWLLDLDLGGELIRVGTGEARPESREAGGEVLYFSGLEDLTSPLTVDRVTVQVGAGNRETWGQYRSHFGPIRGRRARLWYWVEGQILEDSYLILDGVVSSSSWAAPDDPENLTITIERETRHRSVVHPPPEAIVDETAWPQNAGKYIDDGIRLAHYPTVIGTPGDSGNGPVSAPPYLGTPGLYVQDGTTTDYVVIAGHHVAAVKVRLWNKTQGDQTGDLVVVNDTDGRGNKVAYVDARGNWNGGTNLEPADEVYVGWGRGTTDYGPGLTHEGRAVLGLGDLLIWGADQLSTAKWDFAQMNVWRSVLNVFRIDTYWNEPMLWEDWLQANIIGVFPILEVQGPRGRYYRRIEVEADPNDVQAWIATFGSGAGRKVERIGPVIEADGAIVNTLEIDYGARPTSGVARRKLNVGPTKGPVPGPPGGAQLTVNAANMLATVSAGFYGPRYDRLEIPVTWDPATVAQVARHVMASRALPGRRTKYRGGPDLLELYEYATIGIRDTGDGADLDDVLGVVEGITITPTGVDVDVFIPDDPVAGTLT